jgi:hypothetical protein
VNKAIIIRLRQRAGDGMEDKNAIMLRPKEEITRILLSTPSRLVGEYEEDEVLITHAWTKESVLRYVTLDRSYFVLSVKTPPIDRSHVLIPDYSATGDVLCIYLSILYGKRFDNHGSIESLGLFYRPSSAPIDIYDPRLPFNSRTPRPDLKVELSLHEIKRIAPLMNEEHVDETFLRFLLSGGRFYVHALQQAESQPEIAFLDLITCGEILSNFFEYDQDDLLDPQIKNDLAQVEEKIDDGDKIVSRIRNQVFQVKRKFVKMILHLLSPIFFEQTEAKGPFLELDKSDILQSIKAAYDLRSRYVHTGVSFGGWIKPNGGFNNEVQLGTPVIDDKELKKILVRSPTLIGMERIMRFCLLRFIHLYGTPVDDRLDGEGLESRETLCMSPNKYFCGLKSANLAAGSCEETDENGSA